MTKPGKSQPKKRQKGSCAARTLRHLCHSVCLQDKLACSSIAAGPCQPTAGRLPLREAGRTGALSPATRHVHEEATASLSVTSSKHSGINITGQPMVHDPHGRNPDSRGLSLNA